MLKRTDINQNTLSGQAFKHDVKRENIEVIRNSQWSKKNRYDRFSAMKGITPKREMYSVAVPDYVTLSYDFIIWTNFTDQMNHIVEKINWAEGSYWGEPGKFQFRTSIDSFDDAIELETGGDRLVKCTFTLKTNGYLLPETIYSTKLGKVANMKITNTPGQVVFGFEGDATKEQLR